MANFFENKKSVDNEFIQSFKICIYPQKGENESDKEFKLYREWYDLSSKGELNPFLGSENEIDYLTLIICHRLLALPLLKAMDYILRNDIDSSEGDELPNYLRIDVDDMYNILLTLTSKGRDNILNSIDVSSTAFPILKRAILEPDIDSLRMIIEKNYCDITWLQKVLGTLKVAADFGMLKGKDDHDFQNLMAIINDLPSPRYLKHIVMRQAEIGNKYHNNPQLLLEWIKLALKQYWFQADSFPQEIRAICDQLIDNPMYHPIIKEARSEFEQDMRMIKDESKLLPEQEAKEQQQSSLRKDGKPSLSKKVSWLKEPREDNYEGQLGDRIQNELWPWLWDNLYPFEYPVDTEKRKNTMKKYLGAAIIHHVATTMGLSRPFGQNSASSFERIMKFADVKRQTLGKYLEMLDVYEIMFEEEMSELTHDHEGDYLDFESGNGQARQIHHQRHDYDSDEVAAFRKSNQELSEFLISKDRRNYEHLKNLIEEIKPKIKSVI